MTWLLSALNVLLHGLFIWARFAVFRIDGKPPRGVRVLEWSAVSCILVGLVAIALRDGPDAGCDAASAAVAVFSGGVFVWAATTVKRNRLTAAFSDDTPQELITAGPFRWVRNPFYLSYLLAYTQALLAARSWWAVLPLAWMAGVYAAAVWREERKFLRSPLAYRYREYARRTGRFLPVPTPLSRV
jgi:protein-S-isoprenylcysteine O-methyltransferase Ste14